MVHELLIVIFRIFTILPLLLFVTLFMGKRAIGELPVFDFLIIITLASVTGADIADPNIQHIHTVVAIIFLGILQRIGAILMLRYRKIGKAMTFEPTIVVQEGKLLHKNIKALRYSLDNILQMLREKGIFDLGDVRLAIIEGNGKLTVLRIKEKSEVLIEDLNVKKASLSYYFRRES